MNTVIFSQGFNRVEHRQITYLERAKLNRLLDEERRVVETLAHSIRKQFESASNHLLADVETVWDNIENHSFVKTLRERISLLTDAYPQFLRQVEVVRDAIKRKTLAILKAFGTENQTSLNTRIGLMPTASI